MRLLLPYTQFLLSTVITVLGTSPVAVNWSTKSYGHDGPWQVTKSDFLYLPRMGIDAKHRQSLFKWAPTHPATPFQASTCIPEDYMVRRSTQTNHAVISPHPPGHVLPSQQDFMVLTTLSAPIRTAPSRRRLFNSGNGEVEMRRMRISVGERY